MSIEIKWQKNCQRYLNDNNILYARTVIIVDGSESQCKNYYQYTIHIIITFNIITQYSFMLLFLMVFKYRAIIKSHLKQPHHYFDVIKKSMTTTRLNMDGKWEVNIHKKQQQLPHFNYYYYSQSKVKFCSEFFFAVVFIVVEENSN